MKNKQKVKMEFSKKIFYMITVLTIIVIAFSMVLMWRTMDTSALAYLIPGVFGLMATATGFYYSKAKKENEIKLHKQYGNDYFNSSDDSEDIQG